MTIYTLHCQEPWFSAIENREKSVEGRLGSGICTQIKLSDTIKFVSGDRSFLSTVTKIEHYKTISTYLESVGLDRALPGIKTVEEGCHVYLQFYTEQEIDQFGMIAFWINPVET